MAGLPSEKSLKEKTRGMKLNFDYDPVKTSFETLAKPFSKPFLKPLAKPLQKAFSETASHSFESIDI
jgi:hypothetical protein